MNPEDRISQLERRIDELEAGLRNVSAIDPQFREAIEYIFSQQSLNDLKDVSVPSPANNEVLKWDSTLEYWKAATDAT